MRLLDLTQGYAVFANGGYRVEPVSITRVQVRDGETLFTRPTPALTTRLLDERVAWLITDIAGAGGRFRFGQPAQSRAASRGQDRHDHRHPR
ncbi:MAG: hypothetical protein MUC99_10790 [Anaerolineae bacterium]|nr:hypothetical protein [Anaerolineae bacterium]